MAQIGRCHCYCSKQTKLAILGLVIAALAVGTVLLVVFTEDRKNECTTDLECQSFFTTFNRTIETVTCEEIPSTETTPTQFVCKRKINGPGPGKWWDSTTVDTLGVALAFKGQISPEDQGGDCCDLCNEEYPTTTMINYVGYLRVGCHCLKATPGKTPSTDEDNPNYTGGSCGNIVFPALSWANGVDILSVFTFGVIKNVTDSSRCCERCNSVYPGTEIFEWMLKGVDDADCQCHKTLSYKTPSTVTYGVYAGFCNA